MLRFSLFWLHLSLLCRCSSPGWYTDKHITPLLAFPVHPYFVFCWYSETSPDTCTCLIFFGCCRAARPDWQSANYRLPVKITEYFAIWAGFTGAEFSFSFPKPTKQKKNFQHLPSAFSFPPTCFIKHWVWGEQPCGNKIQTFVFSSEVRKGVAVDLPVHCPSLQLPSHTLTCK